MILIGSVAIKYFYPDFDRKSKDIDFVIPSDSTLKSDLPNGYEFIINNIIIDYMESHFYGHHIAPPDVLLTIKASHLAWDIFWSKHMFDATFLVGKGHKIIPDLFYLLYEHHNSYHSKNNRSDLKMNSENFFTNAIKCEYHHDDLHTLLKKEPTYTKVLFDGAEVEVSEEKFNLLNFNEKCDLVTEEVMVMAYERYSHEDYRVAYSRMLKKFIISHAPLWEYIFIIENYNSLYKAKFNFIESIEDNLYQLIKK